MEGIADFFETGADFFIGGAGTILGLLGDNLTGDIMGNIVTTVEKTLGDKIKDWLM